jgi:hypothetical protein
MSSQIPRERGMNGHFRASAHIFNYLKYLDCCVFLACFAGRGYITKIQIRRTHCGNGVWAQGRQGTWNRRVRGCAPQAAPRNFRVFEGPYTRPARSQGRRRQAPQDRRRVTFFGGGAEIRRSRLWSLKLVLDALRCMQPSTKHGLPRPSM